jgi:hypothetical protein
MTITVSEEAAKWARRQAAEQNTSVSKLVGQIIAEKMRQTDDYWKAYKRIHKLKPIPGFDASKRARRDDLYDR